MTFSNTCALRRLAPVVAVGLLLVADGCVKTPSVDGVAGAAPTPNAVWTPPPKALPDTALPKPSPDVPTDIEQRISSLALTDIVDLALRNNPTTKISWANARAAAAAYGSQKGAYLPTIDGEASVTRLKTAATQGRSAVEQTTYGPTLTLSYLVFDLGGRSGAIEAAKQALFVANWTHNATIQNVVLQVQSAYFNYLATRALHEAQLTTVAEADTNLLAARERYKVGVATVADTLQAKTALSQAQLDLETTEGDLQTTRGALAVTMGLPANVPYDIEAPKNVPIGNVADSVDALIEQAVRSRPDLAAAQAQYREARARVKQIRGARLPSVVVNGTAGRTYTSAMTNGQNSYTVTLGLSIPLFAGFSRAYNQLAAEAAADAAAAQAEQVRQQVIFQVFSSYQTLQTATRRVQTADDLLNSAQQSADAALARYRSGVGSVLDLLAAQSALASARAQQVQSRWIWQTALSQLAHDAGILNVHGGNPIRLAPDSTDMNRPQ